MTTCQLTKLETALDQIKKGYTQLAPADAGLIATALSVSGRHALAVYEGAQYEWPTDYQKLAAAMVPHVKITQEALEANLPKRVTKAAAAALEDEVVMINVGLAPNLSAAEAILGDREDLKAFLADILQDGVEFVYTAADIGWQWGLDRVNWATVAGSEVSRRIKVKTAFTEGAVGIETGATKRKVPAPRKSNVPEPIADDAPPFEE